MTMDEILRRHGASSITAGTGPFGDPITTAPCSACNGSGYSHYPRRKCTACNGSGRVPTLGGAR